MKRAEKMQPSEDLFSKEQFQRLVEFQNTLINWNRNISLTSVPSEEIMRRLALPSAWLGKEYYRHNLGVVVDFGAGAGIPGIPMAICDERNRYVLIDSNKKKIEFIKACISSEEIGIKGNAQARAERIVKGKWKEKVNVVVTRGTGTILSILDIWADKIDKQGFIDIFKGEKLDLEVAEMLKKYPKAEYEKIPVPEWFDTLKLIRIKGIASKSA